MGLLDYLLHIDQAMAINEWTPGKTKRLRPWLESLLNRGDVPGLCWFDNERTMFRIPWKHRGKQDWSPDQSRIFMEWAKQTGRYREGVDDEDYPKWKTRLRCAFNKAPDIEEIPELRHLDSADPYRVYRLKQLSANTVRSPSHRVQNMSDMYQQSTESEESNWLPHALETGDGRLERTKEWCNQQMHGLSAAGVTDGVTTTSGSSNISGCADVKRMKLDVDTAAAYDSAACDFMHQLSSAFIVPCFGFQDTKPGVVAIPQHNHIETCDDDWNSVELVVKVQYCGRDVLTKTISNSTGCCLCYQPSLSARARADIPAEFGQILFGPDDVEQIALPPVDELILSDSQRKVAGDLLTQGLTRGLVIKCIDNNLYVYRLCKCATFYYKQSVVYTEGQTPVKVPRTENDPPELTCVFDHNVYVTALKDYLDNVGPKPDPHCVLVFGQDLPYRRPDSTVLVSATIATSRALQDLKKAEAAVDGVENAGRSFVYIERI